MGENQVRWERLEGKPNIAMVSDGGTICDDGDNTCRFRTPGFGEPGQFRYFEFRVRTGEWFELHYPQAG